MKVEIDKKANELVIRLPLQEPTRSSTGKTLVVGSSHGGVATAAVIDGKPVKVNVTSWIHP